MLELNCVDIYFIQIYEFTNENEHSKNDAINWYHLCLLNNAIDLMIWKRIHLQNLFWVWKSHLPFRIDFIINLHFFINISDFIIEFLWKKEDPLNFSLFKNQTAIPFQNHIFFFNHYWLNIKLNSEKMWLDSYTIENYEKKSVIAQNFWNFVFNEYFAWVHSIFFLFFSITLLIHDNGAAQTLQYYNSLI